VIAFRCGGDAGAGRSGSALLLAEGERVEVIGTQSAEGRDALGVVGFAVAPPAP
jgi:hypothetical protein